MIEEKLSLRLRILRKISSVFMKQLPDEMYTRMVYQVRMGKRLCLNPPVTYNEKLNWLKLYDHNPLYTKLADKFQVKEYVSKKIGAQYVIPLLAVWDRVDDIDITALPDEFVLKCTHDSGSVIICRDKNSFDLAAAKEKLKKCLDNNYFYYSREWVYKNIAPRIICEPFIEDFNDAELRDYKFFCFDGKVKFLYVATDRFKKDSEVKFTFFDDDYNFLPVHHGHPIAEPHPHKPDGFENMKHIAETLSKGLKHVRVDLYEANGKIYFSEYTFYNNSAFLKFEPEEWDYRFGEYLQLS